MGIAGMRGFEIVIIVIAILLIFGPKNLPKLGSALGKTMSNLRSGMNEGKKKKGDDAEGEAVTEDGSSTVEPAAIEGEVAAASDAEEVTFDDVAEGGTEAEPVVADEVPAEEPLAAEAPAPADEPAGEQTEAADDQAAADAPKKVRRVVKKKVV